MTYGEHLENHIKKIFPKFLERYEKENGFTLPKIRIDRLECYPSKREWMKGNIVFGPVFFYVSVDVKDGRMGKVKSFLKSILTSAMDSLGYKYDTIYLEVDQTDDLIEESIRKELRKIN